MSVTAPAGCAWTAGSNVSFVTVTGGSAGNGNGTVSYSVAANSGGARSGSMTIAGQIVTISQNAAVASYDGYWQGTTSQGKSFTFTVANNTFTTWTLGWHVDGGCSVDGNTTMNYSTPQPIGGTSFTLSTSGATSITINGTFSSPQAASGNLTVNYSQPSPSCTASGSGTFSVTKY